METINYRNFEIEIVRDDYPENPFENWDGNVPLIYKSSGGSNDYTNGEIRDFLTYNALTDNQVIYHQKKLAEILDIDLDYYKQYDLSKDDKINDIRDAIYENDLDFEILSKICELAKVPYLHTSKSGYSQGDWANIFICETPEFLSETGLEKLTEKEMQSGSNLWAFWAYGDVYGFNIENIDSCSGYYGDDHKKSGLLEEAKNSIDFHIIEIRKNRFSKIKELIKSKVPIFYRKEILINYSI